MNIIPNVLGVIMSKADNIENIIKINGIIQIIKFLLIILLGKETLSFYKDNY